MLPVVLISAPLLYFALQPVRIVNISINPRILRGVTLFSNKLITKPDKNGVVFFDLDGYLEDSSVSQVKLSIRPSREDEWYPHKKFNISKGVFIGTAQLGSPKYPIIQDEQYSFSLVSSDNNILSEGDIVVRVETVAGASQLLIGAIGLMASILQVLSFLIPPKTRQDNVTSPQLHFS